MLKSSGFSQIIKEPTRIAEKESTIDHIICNTSDNVSQSGVLPIGLSDHHLIYCTRKVPKNVFNSHNTVTVRSMKNYSIESYTKLLEETDWSNVLNSSCPDSAWENVENSLSCVLNKVAPHKTIRIKQRTEPWMTPEILDKIYKRDGLALMYKETKEDHFKLAYRKIRNEIQRNIKQAKATYLKESLESHLGQPKKLWQQLKMLGYNNKTKTGSNIVLNIGNKLCDDTKSICSYINTFFTTIASNLVNKLPKPSGIYSTKSNKFSSYYKDMNVEPGHFKLRTLTEEQIYKELTTIDPKKATGLDNIAF